MRPTGTDEWFLRLAEAALAFGPQNVYLNMKTIKCLPTLIGSLFVFQVGLVDAETALQLDLEANVDTRCEVTRSHNESLDLSSNVAGSLGFDLYCNTEMTINLTSANGGLVHEDRTPRSGEDTDKYLRPYDLDIQLRSSGFNASSTSSDLAKGVAYQVPGVVFDDVADLSIKLEKPIDDGFSGRYYDEIRITVTPSLSAIPS